MPCENLMLLSVCGYFSAEYANGALSWKTGQYQGSQVWMLEILCNNNTETQGTSMQLRDKWFPKFETIMLDLQYIALCVLQISLSFTSTFV